jgi:hypothetical protein
MSLSFWRFYLTSIENQSRSSCFLCSIAATADTTTDYDCTCILLASLTLLPCSSPQNRGVGRFAKALATDVSITELDVCLASVDAALKGLATPMTFVDFADQIISPGAYATDAAMALTGTLYLNIKDKDGVNVVDPEWFLYLTGPMIFGAGTKVVFVDVDPTATVTDPYIYDALHHLVFDPTLPSTDAGYHDPTIVEFVVLAAGVHWKIIGAIIVGVESNISGDMKSNGAIAVGASAHVGGNLDALGTVTLGPGCSVAGTIRATGASTEGGCSQGGIYDPATIQDSVIQGEITVCKNYVAAIKEVILMGPGCAPYPCQNGGTCTDTGLPNDYSCACASGWTGTDCDEDTAVLLSPVARAGDSVSPIVRFHPCRCRSGDSFLSRINQDLLALYLYSHITRLTHSPESLIVIVRDRSVVVRPSSLSFLPSTPRWPVSSSQRLLKLMSW